VANQFVNRREFVRAVGAAGVFGAVGGFAALADGQQRQQTAAADEFPKPAALRKLLVCDGVYAVTNNDGRWAIQLASTIVQRRTSSASPIPMPSRRRRAPSRTIWRRSATATKRSSTIPRRAAAPTSRRCRSARAPRASTSATARASDRATRARTVR
jgi:hypothetical protein